MTTATGETRKKAINTDDIAKAEVFGKDWLKAKAAKAKAEADMKQAATQLETFAKKNRSAFGDLGTLKVGNVKLKFVNAGKVKTNEDFVATEFAEDFPELVNISISVAALKGYLVNDELADEIAACGVEYTTEEKFSVEKA